MRRFKRTSSLQSLYRAEIRKGVLHRFFQFIGMGIGQEHP